MSSEPRVKPGTEGSAAVSQWRGGHQICTVKVKYLARLRAGDMIATEAIHTDGPYPVYGGNGLRGYTSEPTHAGTHILIGRQGALCGNVRLVSGEFWASEHAIVVSPHLGVSPRWLAYVLGALKLGQHSRAAAQPGIGVAQISELPVIVPSSDEQRRIADFLDRECGRIAELGSRLRRQVALLEEWFERRRAELLASDALQPLKAALRDASVGIVVQPARLYDDAGEVLCLRAVDVQNETLVRDAALRIGRLAHAAHPRSALERGDVVVVRTGKAGMAAVVPEWAVGANCVDLLILRPEPSRYDSRFLGEVLNSEEARRQVAHASVGSIQGHMNLGAIRRLQVPRITLEEQRVRAERVSTLRLRVSQERLLALSAEQRLEEYKDALITEAVNGQLHFPWLSDAQLDESARAAIEGGRPEVLSA